MGSIPCSADSVEAARLQRAADERPHFAADARELRRTLRPSRASRAPRAPRRAHRPRRRAWTRSTCPSRQSMSSAAPAHRGERKAVGERLAERREIGRHARQLLVSARSRGGTPSSSRRRSARLRSASHSARARAIHSGDGMRSTTGSMAIAASRSPASATARSSAGDVVERNRAVVAPHALRDAGLRGTPVVPAEVSAADHHVAAGVRPRDAHGRAHRLRAGLQELHALRARHHVAEPLGDLHFEHVREARRPSPAPRRPARRA